MLCGGYSGINSYFNPIASLCHPAIIYSTFLINLQSSILTNLSFFSFLFARLSFKNTYYYRA
ncbi:hypothetical protein BDV36DRAFT_265270 [Aspergillus pseudocaelatus]|uniref:Uncharacterized protein n=1 Tax=Aspergillus pseudocaelatus TaxID=1825620 RepID=A0ABQ6WE31_9EURO|nr:hypothetical protein BDV36DRAFT_265270 [Aspergillus pseudocaelatus]